MGVALTFEPFLRRSFSSLQMRCVPSRLLYIDIFITASGSPMLVSVGDGDACCVPWHWRVGRAGRELAWSCLACGDIWHPGEPQGKEQGCVVTVVR